MMSSNVDRSPAHAYQGGADPTRDGGTVLSPAEGKDGKVWHLAPFEWVMVLIVLSTFAIESWQDRLPMSDLSVYLRAGRRVWRGEPLYMGNRYEFYRFKYPPPAALLFTPFSCLPIWMARFLYGLMLLACLLLILRRLAGWSSPSRQGRWPFLCWLLAFGGIIHYELNLGQVTLPLLLMFLGMADLLALHKDMAAGLLLGLSLILKPFGWPLVLWGMARQRWKFLLSTGLIVTFLSAVPIGFYGWEGALKAWAGFFRELSDLDQSKAQVTHPDNRTFAAFLARILVRDSSKASFNTDNESAGPAPPRPDELLVVGVSPQTWILLINGGLLLLAGWAIWRVRTDATPLDPHREFALLLTLVPLIGPSEYKYYLLSAPALWMGLAAWPQLNRTQRLLVIGGVFGLGGNIYNLWGKAWSKWLSEFGLVTLGGFCAFLLAATLQRAPGAMERPAGLFPPADPGLSSTPEPGFPRKGVHWGFPLAAGILLLFWMRQEIVLHRNRLLCPHCGQDMTLRQSKICKNCSHPGPFLPSP